MVVQEPLEFLRRGSFRLAGFPLPVYLPVEEPSMAESPPEDGFVQSYEFPQEREKAMPF